MTLVVDASAIGALVFGEEAAPWVRAATEGQALMAPGLLAFELGNLCWKKMRRFPAEAEHFLLSWTVWQQADLVAVAETDAARTMQFARDYGLTFYDASYLSLAHDRAASLISLDAELVIAARKLGVDAPRKVS
jgi:predicted nucleic acid-binding protein